MTTPKTNLFTDEDIRKLDASYKSFPSFAEWSKATLNLKRWKRYTDSLAVLKQSAPEVLKESQAIVERATAFDTGAIEGLYELPRGFTITVATQAVLWEVAVQEKIGQKGLGYIKAQLEAYEYILDIATKRTPLTQAAIRELHEVMCRNQDTYTAYNKATGLRQQLILSKGQYKVHPNHVIGRDDKYHAHAPVEETPREMQLFVTELQSEAFQNAHPVLQASYAHYAFVLIHPFADGNGRVARALAAIYTYRDQSVPLLILSEKREEYLNALADADVGNYQSFVDFVLERTFESIQLFSDSIRVAKENLGNGSVNRLSALGRTKGGYTHAEVNKAGEELEKLFYKVLDDQAVKMLQLNPDNWQPQVVMAVGQLVTPEVGYRSTNSQKRIEITLKTINLLIHIEISRLYDVIIPNDGDSDDDVIIREMKQGGNVTPFFTAMMSELVPQISGVVTMRLSMLTEGIVKSMWNELSEKAVGANRNL